MLTVPTFILSGFVLSLILQILNHLPMSHEKHIDYESLSQPYHASIYQGLAMGSDQLFSYLLAIRLQLHDNQIGGHVRYNHIYYDQLITWLNRLYQLNPASQYPIFLATNIYTQTTDKQQLSKMLQLIDALFTTNPKLFWHYQVQAAVIAKHKLGDPQFALRIAQKLSIQPEIPQWARDMHFLLLADLHEYQSALVIIKNLLAGGTITDQDELFFLREKQAQLLLDLASQSRGN